MQAMPEGFRQAIHFTSCKHIADIYVVQRARRVCFSLFRLRVAIDARRPCFQNTLVRVVKKFNIVALFNINHDVRTFEEFARSCGIPELDTKFAEIRQVFFSAIVCWVVLGGKNAL